MLEQTEQLNTPHTMLEQTEQLNTPHTMLEQTEQPHTMLEQTEQHTHTHLHASRAQVASSVPPILLQIFARKLDSAPSVEVRGQHTFGPTGTQRHASKGAASESVWRRLHLFTTSKWEAHNFTNGKFRGEHWMLSAGGMHKELKGICI